MYQLSRAVKGGKSFSVRTRATLRKVKQFPTHGPPPVFAPDFGGFAPKLGQRRRYINPQRAAQLRPTVLTFGIDVPGSGRRVATGVLGKQLGRRAVCVAHNSGAAQASVLGSVWFKYTQIGRGVLPL